MFQKACLWLLICGMFYLVSIAKADAEEPLHVASTVSFEKSWMSHALSGQRRFVYVLSNQTRPVIFDVVPLNRYDDLMKSAQTDCVMSPFPAEFANVIVANHRIGFELKLFGRKGVAFDRLDRVEIGHLANIPRPSVPLQAELNWNDVRSIEQGVELLDARRIDVLIADSTHIRMHENPEIVELNYPPVRIVELALVCRDTEPLREFISDFDSSMGVFGSLDFLPQDGRCSVMNVW